LCYNTITQLHELIKLSKQNNKIKIIMPKINTAKKEKIMPTMAILFFLFSKLSRSQNQTNYSRGECVWAEYGRPQY